jgi:hypothetical protein
MKIPEPLFAVINPIVRILLQSPIHAFWSDSLMLITVTGRKSNRRYTIPVRYVRDGEVVRCFTTSTTLWWRNLRGEAEVHLRIKGEEKRYNAIAIHDDPHRIREGLLRYLELYPQDAAYHGIRLNEDKSLVAEDLDRACSSAIVIEARPIP